MKRIVFGFALIAAVILSGCINYKENYYNACEKDSDCVGIQFGDLSKPGSVSGSACANVKEYPKYFKDAKVDDSQTCVCGAQVIFGKRLCTGKAPDWEQCNADSDCKKLVWNYKSAPEGKSIVCTPNPQKYLERGFNDGNGGIYDGIDYNIADSTGCSCKKYGINSVCEYQAAQ